MEHLTNSGFHGALKRLKNLRRRDDILAIVKRTVRGKQQEIKMGIVSMIPRIAAIVANAGRQLRARRAENPRPARTPQEEMPSENRASARHQSPLVTNDNSKPDGDQEGRQ
jgi:hypothetical protein